MSETKRRRTFEDFECRFDERDHCWEGCDGFDDCDVGAVYREYLALQKCARLLRVFEKRWIDSIEYAIEDPSSWIQGATAWWGKWALFVRAIRAALREAGL